MERDTDAIDENAIREKAHELWVERGCPTGSPEVDWKQAEELLRAEAQRRYAFTARDTTNAAERSAEGTKGNGKTKRRGS